MIANDSSEENSFSDTNSGSKCRNTSPTKAPAANATNNVSCKLILGTILSKKIAAKKAIELTNIEAMMAIRAMFSMVDCF